MKNDKLIAARDQLKKAANEYESNVNRREAWAEKLDELEPELDELKVSTDPLDEEALNHLLIVNLQVELLRERVEGPPPSVGQLAQSISRAHDEFQKVAAPLLKEFQQRRTAQIAETLQLGAGSGAVLGGYLERDMQWLHAMEFSSGRSWRVENSPSAARAGIDAIDQLIEGTSPLTAKPPPARKAA